MPRQPLNRLGTWGFRETRPPPPVIPKDSRSNAAGADSWSGHLGVDELLSGSGLLVSRYRKGLSFASGTRGWSSCRLPSSGRGLGLTEQCETFQRKRDISYM